MSEEFLHYQIPDGTSRFQVRLEGRTLWLTQQQLADLYESTPQNITQHVHAIYAESELIEEAVCKPYLQVRDEAGRQVRRSLKHYKSDVNKATIEPGEATVTNLNSLSMPGIGVSNEPR